MAEEGSKRCVEVMTKNGHVMIFSYVTACCLTDAPERAVKIMEHYKDRTHITLLPLAGVEYVKDKRTEDGEA